MTRSISFMLLAATLMACTGTESAQPPLRFAVAKFQHETCTFCPGGDTEVDDWIREHRFLDGYPGVDHPTNSELLEIPCEILIPAAVQNQITEANADRIECRLLAEGANGPTSLEADAILASKGVFVVPDILANAGGVTVSYFEWVQGLQQFFWSEEEVNNRLIALMQRAFHEVLGVSKQRKVDLRMAALIRGVDRVKEAKRRRGVFP